jgi:hypothetical protein
VDQVVGDLSALEAGVERLAFEHVGAANLDAGVLEPARALRAAGERDHTVTVARQPAGHEAADIAGRAGYGDPHP